MLLWTQNESLMGQIISHLHEFSQAAYEFKVAAKYFIGVHKLAKREFIESLFVWQIVDHAGKP